MFELSFEIPTVEALHAWAAKLARTAPDSMFVGLIGDLGAGKTAIVWGFVAALDGGDQAEVSSPTYALVQPYDTSPPVQHVDLYRLHDEEEWEVMGGREIFHGPGLILVEWIDRLPETVPDQWVEIRLAAQLDDVREIRVRTYGLRAESWVRKAFDS